MITGRRRVGVSPAPMQHLLATCSLDPGFWALTTARQLRYCTGRAALFGFSTPLNSFFMQMKRRALSYR
ncbi:hypothetical protein KCP77_19245 [Salmonella enterica subsp. enterica]|nr:hypothetical protein KCP77_19245 [Salmonella enterica subsp. enterica]